MTATARWVSAHVGSTSIAPLAILNSQKQPFRLRVNGVNHMGRRDLLRLCSVVLMPAVVRAARPFALEERRIANQSEEPAYEIDLRYPYLRDPGNPATARAFNAAVDGMVQRRLARYRAKQLPPKDSPHGGALILESTVTTWRDSVVSVFFDWSHLARRKGEDQKWIERGAGPVARNFRVFTLTNQALALHFETYQVGSYVEGAKEVRIPWKTLEPQLAARWRDGF
jgi:hypothetical protein